MKKRDITIIIKTFERKKCLFRLLKSIKENYWNEIKVIIADDSKKSSKKEADKLFKDIIRVYIVLPYDVGPSIGRQKMLKEVKTPYFVLCDDDFVFEKKINFYHFIKKMEQEQIDILWGDFINEIPCLLRTISFLKKIIHWQIKLNLLNKRYVSTFFGKITNNFKVNNTISNRFICELNSSYGNFGNSDIKKVDFTNNFFIWKTERVVKEGWWHWLSHIWPEHLEFFLRMKNKKVKVGYTAEMKILHKQVFKIGYLLKRFRNKKNNINYITKDGIVKS